jgi:hypothetical protein
LKQTNSFNLNRFINADKKRRNLLSLLPDQFTPVQAAEAWGMDYTKAKTQTAKMRELNLITSNEDKKGRIFTKVKDQENEQKIIVAG